MPLVLALELHPAVEVPTSTQTEVVTDETPLVAPVTVIS
jgi:hypothetical protein